MAAGADATMVEKFRSLRSSRDEDSRIRLSSSQNFDLLMTAFVYLLPARANVKSARLGGKAYYNIAPPEPSTWHIVVSMTLILTALTAFSTVVAVGIAPLQNKLGFHRQSLARMINAIGDRFILKAAKDGANHSS